MAVSLTRGVRNCQDLAQAVEQQLREEVQADPLSQFPLQQLNALVEAVQKVSAFLSEEEQIFASDADLSGFETEKLTTLASDVREASRKLAIVLAAGCNQFRAQQGGNADVLQSLAGYFHPSIQAQLEVDQLVHFLRSQEEVRSGVHRHGAAYEEEELFSDDDCGYNCPRPGPDPIGRVMFDGNFAECGTGAETLQKLSKHLSVLAEHCSKLQKEREDDAKQQDEKQRASNLLKTGVASLVPMLRKHVLRVGIGKVQMLNLSQGCANVSTLSSMFDYAAVEDAHRQLEDGRDRILQEVTLRKLQAKLVRGGSFETSAAKRGRQDGSEQPSLPAQ